VVEETLSPGVNNDRYVVSYLSEGLKQYAMLTVPQGEQPATGWPAIIFNHGYIPPEVYRTTERYVAYVDGFARSGYVVFRPDYRGHGFSEGEARGAYGNPDYVLNALASVKRLDYVDTDRIGMWGHSMGGYITLRAMVTDPTIKAGVIWAGVVASYPDLVARWNRQRSITPPTTATPAARRWRQQLLEQYGTPEENPEYWASISANSYLADLSGPVQIHHGTEDTDVPVEFSVTLFDQIKAAGQVGEVYTYLGDDHNISQSLNTAIARSVAFFDQHVKNAVQ
jgi:dipeptidyl aminopeptidase/acylaminoacyl peptidase